MARATPIAGLTRRTRVNDAAPRILQARLADVRRWESRVAASLRGEPIHAMRVATRRLRAVLKLFPNDGLRPNGELKRLQDALGRVRDLEILGDSAVTAEERNA